MSPLTLELPQTLRSELELLAGDEGVSLERYIMYTLTQKVTLAKLAFQKHQPIELTPAQIRLLAQVRPVSEADIAEQTDAFAALCTRLGPPASDEEMKAFLAMREPAPPDPDLNPEAATRFRQRLGI